MVNARIHDSPARLQRVWRRSGVVWLAILLGAALPASAQTLFAKPEAAANALIDAIATNDAVAMALVLGADWMRLIPKEGISNTDVLDFLEKASQSRSVLVKDGRGDLVVGTDPFTLPIPLVQAKDGQWRFDIAAGRESIAERRIGANERAAMQAVLAYLDAQREYATADRNGDGVLEYAQKFISSPGQRDGLIWSRSLGDESPLGESFAPAKPGAGYHGYRFKILTAQGPAAKGGARPYFIGPRMTAGFALLAWPVAYGKTGVMSFKVGSDGAVFERNLGPQGAQVATGIKEFNPDDSWRPAMP